MADTTDLTEKELSQVDACVAAVRAKELGNVDSPALLIVDVVDRLVQEVRRRRREAGAYWLMEQPEATK